MMPEMDGITTMQEIRKLPEKKDLPIIAVTAKAMKGDREKCIDSSLPSCRLPLAALIGSMSPIMSGGNLDAAKLKWVLNC